MYPHAHPLFFSSHTRSKWSPARSSRVLRLRRISMRPPFPGLDRAPRGILYVRLELEDMTHTDFAWQSCYPSSGSLSSAFKLLPLTAFRLALCACLRSQLLLHPPLLNLLFPSSTVASACGFLLRSCLLLSVAPHSLTSLPRTFLFDHLVHRAL